MKKNLKIIAITTGDSDGIGLEVTIKALNHLSQNLIQNHFLVFRSTTASLHHIKQLKTIAHRKFGTLIETDSCAKAVQLINYMRSKEPLFITIVSKKNPALWVEEVARLCLEKKVDAMVTGPISKELIIKSGLKDIGHTGILQRISKSKYVFMCFLGKNFNVVCLTGHIPIKSIESLIDQEKINVAIKLTNNFRKSLSPKNKLKPIGILGLNPHASENGLIGNFDSNFLKKWIKKFKFVNGPLIPDVAFQKKNWHQFSIYISLYHDQGLIPFKMIHGQNSGAHITLGIPFIRTSVDHGTAKDIYNKNIANHRSMLDAIRWALKLIKSENKYVL